MSNLRMLKKKYYNALSTCQFSKGLLNASISTQEILGQKLKKITEIKRICCIIHKIRVSNPQAIALCGPNDMFPGDFKHIMKEKGDILLGKKVKGMSYSINSLNNSLDFYNFKYMDFATNQAKSMSVSSILEKTDTWNCFFHIDKNLKEFIYKQIWKFILITVQYNEQKYRVIAINKFVNNCEKHLRECQVLYYKARNAEITNQIITFRNT
jgi:hypothetical protein